MLSIIEAAGWPIWFLILASVVALALIIERGMALRRSRVVPAGLLGSTMTEFRSAGATDDLLSRLEDHSPLGRVLAAGLRNEKSTREVMKEAIEEAGRGEAHELERYLTTLGTIAAVAPLWGLFGTIVGMIVIFGAAADLGQDPHKMAHGISIALYNTGMGLIIAVPALIAYRHFRARVDSLVIEMELQALKLVEMVHGERR